MKPTIDTFCGSPIEIDSEKDFFGKLCADLSARGERALVFGNFFPPPNPLQIDFLIVTSRCACHVELKKLTAPVLGGVNGHWSLRQPNGTTMKLEVKNPYRQALDGKFAIGDAMSEFTRSNRSIPVPASGRFVQHISSVVCVYPELLPGSSVFQDYKVGVVGYGKLLEILCERDCNPGWSWDHWVAFAMHMGLVKEDPSTSNTPPEAKAAREAVESYNQRFVDFYRGEVTARVDTVLKSQRDTDSTPNISTFSDGSHLQLLGPSGCGKTLLAKHLAINSIATGRTPLFVYAKEYDGKLSALLDRSIAHLHANTAMNLLSAAQRSGTRLGLVIDGLNECPANLQKTLIKDLQAFCLRWQVPVLITSQEPVDLPELLSGGRIEFQPLTADEKIAIVRAAIGRDVPEVMSEVCLGFESAYELSLLAACAVDAGEVRTRAELFDAYVRLRCDTTTSPMIVRRILGSLGHLMMQQLASSLTMAEVWRVANKVLTAEGGRVEHVAAAINSGLLHVRQGRCSFRHEMLERWFQAEELVHRTSGEEVGEVLSLPRNRGLAEFVLAVEPDSAVVQKCLEELADSKALANCLLGSFGEVARRVAEAECSRVLLAAHSALEAMTFEFIDDENWGQVRAVGGPTWSAFDRAVMSAIGVSVARGQFVDEYLRLVRSTEDACRSALANSQGDNWQLGAKEGNALFASLYVFIHNGRSDTLPASTIFHSIRSGMFSRPKDAVGKIASRLLSLVCDLEARLPGELYVISTLLQDVVPLTVEAVPAILKAGWASGLYHLRLQVLQLAEHSSQIITGSAREELVDYLQSLHPKHIFLSTALVETLTAYNLVESPVSPDTAIGEVEAILSGEASLEACQLAYSVVSNIFEDIFQGAYDEAIEQLSREDRARLLVMAALGAPDHGSSTDWILRELVRLDDPSAVTAFRRWAQVPGKDIFSPQETTAKFVAALEGCAQHLNAPPEMTPPQTDDERAWQAYATIIYWLAKPGISDVKRRERCATVWGQLHGELAFQAVDPLQQFDGAGFFQHKTQLTAMIETFPNEVRAVLEFGLRHQKRLTSVFTHAFHSEKRLPFLIGWLSRVGTSSTIGLLEHYLDSPEVGEAAAEAIKAIKAAQSN